MTTPYTLGDVSRERLRRKADHHNEMASLASRDGDYADAERHASLAREYEEMLRATS